MIHTKTRSDLNFYRFTNINNGANALMFLGSQLLGTQADARSLPYLRFGLFADQALTLAIEALDRGAGTLRTPISALVPASTYFDTYNLPAPYGSNGVYVVQWPLVQIRLTNASGANTTVLQFWASLSNMGS